MRENERENIMSNFDEKLDSFVKGVNQIVAVHFATQFPTLEPKSVVVTGGRKYIKLCNVEHGQVSSVWGFVNAENGDVLKAASFKAPAKHARGNIFDDHNGLKTVSAYGPAYL